MESYLFGHDLNVIYHSVSYKKIYMKRKIDKALSPSCYKTKPPPFPANVRPKKDLRNEQSFKKQRNTGGVEYSQKVRR